ncbi:UBX domain-containing protein 6-like [Uloborus diversus]|uniref:UBX domain-containing protein 6-like n=1 Tax=Uloborus diversus TaxID=327109 RepID=UPI00240A9AD0|nr:UBX domain-containing protein 6-like [Uloborus diversus]
MNPIKEFFRKKASERKFKTAGPGHKLNESTSHSTGREKPSQSSSSARGPTQFSEGAQRAGAAALARIEQKQNTVNWSLQATKAQARKELELEKSAKLKQATGPKEVIEDSCPVLAVSGVFFTCPMIGPEILPKDEIESRIKEFLYAQLEEERGLTACLIIHTLNKNKEKVRIGVETLTRYLTNIIDNPTEEKFRKIRFKNKIFQDRILDLEGAFDFLTAAGFVQETINTNGENEEYFVFPTENLENLENLQILKEALLSAERIKPVLDRNLKVLRLSQTAEQINLPNEFFNLTAEEVKREQEAKSESVELLSQLRTKAMRERDGLKEIHYYKFSLIRIRFPDGIIIQGTFYVYEKLAAVIEFIKENLSDPEKDFQLLLLGGVKVSDSEKSLLELKLVPAVLLNFQYSSDIPSETVSYLKSDTLSLLTDS